MARRLVFHPDVPGDLVAAIEHYDAISPTLAARFREQVNLRLDDISNRPDSFPTDVPPIRFARLRRFPFLIFFVDKREFVSILAILHGSTEPSKWRGRSSS